MKFEDSYCYTHGRQFQVLYYPSGAVAYGCPECMQNVKMTASDRTICNIEPYFDADRVLKSHCDDCPYNPSNGGGC